MFILSDTQIIKEGFLEDINNLINIGEVPNLMEGEDRQTIFDALKDVAI